MPLCSYSACASLDVTDRRLMRSLIGRVVDGHHFEAEWWLRLLCHELFGVAIKDRSRGIVSVASDPQPLDVINDRLWFIGSGKVRPAFTKVCCGIGSTGKTACYSDLKLWMILAHPVR